MIVNCQLINQIKNCAALCLLMHILGIQVLQKVLECISTTVIKQKLKMSRLMTKQNDMFAQRRLRSAWEFAN